MKLKPNESTKKSAAEAVALFRQIGTSHAAALCGNAQDFRKGSRFAVKRGNAMRQLRTLATTK